MKYFLTLILAITLAGAVYAQSTTPRNGDEKDYKDVKTSSDGAGKEVKTNGKISSAGCETKEGKTITEAEQGYDECVRQIGTKHHKKKKKKVE